MEDKTCDIRRFSSIRLQQMDVERPITELGKFHGTMYILQVAEGCGLTKFSVNKIRDDWMSFVL